MNRLRKQDNDSIIAKVEDKLASSNTVEIVVNIFKAVLATTPFSGE
jgi:hypothetical protein